MRVAVKQAVQPTQLCRRARPDCSQMSERGVFVKIGKRGVGWGPLNKCMNFQISATFGFSRFRFDPHLPSELLPRGALADYDEARPTGRVGLLRLSPLSIMASMARRNASARPSFLSRAVAPTAPVGDLPQGFRTID